MQQREEGPQRKFEWISWTVRQVIRHPVTYYRDMPKRGGFFEPVLFTVIMGIVAGLIRSILGIFGLSSGGAGSILFIPVSLTILGFAAASIFFVIWILMGSRESFETAYRCYAYATSITPVAVILNVIPYLGTVIWLGWLMYLMIIASIEVQGMEPKMSWIVFGAIFLFLSLISISTQYTARKTQNEIKKLRERTQNSMKMASERAQKEVFPDS